MELIVTNPNIEVGSEILLFCKGKCLLFQKKKEKKKTQSVCWHVFFTLRVQAGAEGEITWKKNGVDFDDEEKVKIIDESNSKIVIKNASLQDAGKYTCTCEFDSGHSDHMDVSLYIYGM